MTQATVKPMLNWFILMAIIGLYLGLAYLIPPGADTLWRLHIATGLLDGQVLYRDIIEVNPPLWFWGAMPAAALGGYPALVWINLVATLVGVGLFGALLRLTQTDKVRWAAMLSLVIGLALVSVAEIGQREQAFLLACALWCGLAGARIESKTVPVWLAVLVTAFCAYGFALKHYFVLVPIAIEVLMIWHKRRAWTPFRVETVLLGTLAIAYGTAVVFITPDFLGRILGLVDLSYYGFGPSNTNSLSEHLWSLILKCALVGIPLIAIILTPAKSSFIQALVLALGLSVVIILLQQKGWRYHLIGANGLSILIMSVLWQSEKPAASSKIEALFLPFGLAALVLTAVVQPTISSLKTNGQPLNSVLANLIAREPKGHHIAILSTAPDNAYFPLARAKRAHWSRHYSMWMLPGLSEPHIDSERETLRLAERARILAEFTADLMCTPPDIMVGEVGYFRNLAPNIFETMGFLAEDREFAGWLQTHYRRAANVGRYPVWRLAGKKPAPQNCSKLSLR